MIIFSYIFIFLAVSLFALAFIRLINNDLLKYKADYIITLSELFIFLEPRRLLMYYFIVIICGLLCGCFIFCISGQITYLFISAILSILSPVIWLRFMKKKRFKLFDEQLPDSLTILSNSLRAGQNLSLAINTLVNEQIPPISQEFALVIMQNRIGLSIKKALENLSERVLSEDLKKNEDLQLLVTSINIVHDMGGKLTIIFQSIEELIRKRKRIQKKIRSLTALGKIQGTITSLIPFGIGTFMYYTCPNEMNLMLTSNFGRICILIIIILQIIGFFAIRKITDIKV